MPITPKLNLDPILPQPMYPQAIFVRGRVGYAYIFRQYGMVRHYSKYCYPYDPKSELQLAHRHKIAYGNFYWHSFDDVTKQFYNNKIYPKRMTGFNRYMYYYFRT